MAVTTTKWKTYLDQGNCGMLPATIGDISGFAGIIFTGLSAFMMVARSKLLKVTKNIKLIRSVHIAISSVAGLFMLVHISYYISYPMSTGIFLGYVAIGIAVAVWLTGSAFLERVKDSLLFHGSLSLVFLTLVLIHAASSAINFPVLFSEILVIGTLGVLFANIGYHVMKI